MRRIGIDVGGTNTDAAVVAVGAGRSPEVIASVKTPTTEDVLGGIVAALAAVPHDDVSVVVIGTTHFTNAVVQRVGLNRVGFLRLCLPTGRSLLPTVGWPRELADAVHGDTVLVRGGIEYDGRVFEELDEAAVRDAATRFGESGIDSVVVSGSFSPVDTSQEERAADLLRDALPGVRITQSHELGRLGLLERENAAGLNAALLDLARTTIDAFSRAVTDSGLPDSTRVFLSQNDGTMLDVAAAARHPVLTFASGPTNSMRGAALLGGVSDGLVVDVGGTTADFGALVAGYPRQANSAVDVGGVRTLFQLPDLLSIGLGGGSIVRRDPLRLGPDSVGQRLLDRALVTGGDTYTLTDAAVSTGRLSVDGWAAPDVDDASAVLQVAADMIAEGADRMKVTAGDVPLIAVGGGAFAVPDQVAGVNDVIRPAHAGVANAVGAALAQVSGEVDRVFRDVERDDAVAMAIDEATTSAIDAGADAASVETIEIEDLPIAYLPGNARRVRIRVVGDLAE